MLARSKRLDGIRRTTTFRLTAFYGVGLGFAIVALLGLIYGLTARELTARSDRILRSEARSLLAVDPAGLPDRIRLEVSHGVRGFSFFALLARDGTRVAGNLAVEKAPPPGDPVDAVLPSGRPLRLLAVRTDLGETILVGRDTSQIRDLRRILFRILLASGITIAVVGLATGIGLSIRPLRRVAEFRRAAELIAGGDLDVRMPLSNRQDELDAFAAAVNVMVDEMSRVLDQVKGASDAIAHDLRTPLTRVRALLARAQGQAGGHADGLIDRAIGDLDVVLERFAALLRISALEASVRQEGFGPVDLKALVHDVAELYQPLAEERGQRLRAHAELPAIAIADGKLLFEALSNLVDNAIKFTPDEGEIELALVGSDAEPWLEVRDSGPGIAPGERRAVLRRFHRGTHAGGITGSGLGLSVVAAIVHIHRFALDLQEAQPGLRARIGCFRSGAGSPPAKVKFI